MSHKLDDLSLFEENESNELEEDAARRAMADTQEASSMIVSATIQQVQDESLDRFESIRNDLDFNDAIDKLHVDAAKSAFKSLKIAIETGFTTDVEGRAAIHTDDPGTLVIEADVTEEDLDPLLEYPVLGHTIGELAIHLADNLKFQAISTANGPVRGEFTLSQLPQNLDNDRERFARQVSQAVNTTYITGTQAASEFILGGIINASQG